MGWLSDLTGGLTDFISDPLAKVDDQVNDAIPGGWLTVGGLAAGGYGLMGGFGAGAAGAEAAAAGTAGLSSADAAALFGSAGYGEGVAAGTAGMSAADAAMASSLNAAGYWAGPAAATGTSGAGSWLTSAAGQSLTGNLIGGGINALLGGGSKSGATAAANAADPFASQRAQYQPMLAQLMTGKFSPADPSYAWRFQQGQQATDRAQAAMGNLMSGNRLTALTEYGQGMASTEYGNQFQRLAQLSGAMGGSSGQAGSILANQATAGQNALGTFASSIGKAVAQPAASWLSSLF